MKSIFSKIIDREAKADIVFEDDAIIAIKDIAPKAAVHLLIIPKKPIPTLQEMQEEDLPLLQQIVKVAQKLAATFKCDKTGYRLLVNNGQDAGQVVNHLHFHLLGGNPLGRMADEN